MQTNNVRLIASSKVWMEGEALRQLEQTALLEGMVLAVGLPDLHPGKGHPVGAAFVAADRIYPYLIGNDIGCGMGFWQTDIPVRKVKLDRWAGRLCGFESAWEGPLDAWRQREGITETPFDVSLGTIGGGNHFAEMQRIESVEQPEMLRQLGLEQDRVCLLVHSGSRGLGESILRGYVERHGAAGVPLHSTEARSYLEQHDQAVRWARGNRSLIAQRWMEQMGGEHKLVCDSCHNSLTLWREADRTLCIHRKGATPSEAPVLVIAGSRGTLSYLVKPLGDGAAHGWSLAHGAGRKWTRSDTRARVRDRFRPEQLVQTELGSRVICEDRDLLYEEAPVAYKKIESVIGELVDAGLIEVVATLCPLLTYKVRQPEYGEQ